jgi:hypothetical protein
LGFPDGVEQVRPEPFDSHRCFHAGVPPGAMLRRLRQIIDLAGLASARQTLPANVSQGPEAGDAI